MSERTITVSIKNMNKQDRPIAIDNEPTCETTRIPLSNVVINVSGACNWSDETLGGTKSGIVVVMGTNRLPPLLCVLENIDDGDEEEEEEVDPCCC